MALVRIICPYALITFPPINYNNRKARIINKFACKLSPVLINGINRTKEVIKATKGAMSLLVVFCLCVESVDVDCVMRTFHTILKITMF